MSFEFRGRDDDGVFAFTGADRIPPLAEWLVVLALGLVFLSAVILGGIAAATHGRIGLLAAALIVSALVGRLTVSGAVWWLRVRRRISGLESLQELSDRTGVGEDALTRAAKRTDIRPIYRVNRVALYDPADFDAAGLLRAADADADLLRPVHNTVSPDVLPIPSDRP